MGLLATELWQAEHNLFCLQLLKPVEVDVTDPFVPHVNVRFNLLSLGKHCGADDIRLEDEHSPFLAPLHDNLEPDFEMSEPDLYSFVDDLTDQLTPGSW